MSADNKDHIVLVTSFGQVTINKLFLQLKRGSILISSKTAFTPEEQAAVQSALQERLGPEYISQRSGAGGQKVKFVRVIMVRLLYSVSHSKSGQTNRTP